MAFRSVLFLHFCLTLAFGLDRGLTPCSEILSLQAPLRLTHLNLPDPRFDEGAEGTVRVSGTSFHVLTYPSFSNLHAGDAPQVERLHLYRRTPEGLIELRPWEVPWAVTFKRWKLAGNDEIEALYGAVMMPPDGQCHAHWPDSNLNRRITTFLRDDAGRWVIESIHDPKPGWSRHAYDIDFFTDLDGEFGEVGATYAYYARVDEIERFDDGSESPVRTGIYARKMIPSRGPKELPQFGRREFKIARTSPWSGGPIYPSTLRRRHWSSGQVSLLEGPRVRAYSIPLSKIRAPIHLDPSSREGYILVRTSEESHRLNIRNGRVTLLLMGQSANDFEEETYGVHFAVGFHPLRRFYQFLNDAGVDLENFSPRLGLSAPNRLAAGRPDLVPTRSGLLFHATENLAEVDTLIRSPYWVEIDVHIDEMGHVQIQRRP